MKYIITETQQKRMARHISEILNSGFEKTNIICDVTVYEINEEDFDMEHPDLKYDIFVAFNEKYIRTAGLYGFKVATERKIRQTLRDYLGLKNYEYFISTFAKDC